jgi:hypothetical protein
MPHGFRVDRDDSQTFAFSKKHDTGERTDIEGRKIPGEEWEVTVRDPRGNMNLGRFGTKTDAKNRAKRFMRENPKGVPHQDNGIAGMGGGIPGTDGNGLF